MRLRRIEMITGAERRRKWSAEEKAEIIAESLAEGAVVSEVARRHGLSPQQLFGWRARLRDAVRASAPSSDATPAFVPAIVENEPPCAAAPSLPATALAMGATGSDPASIEIAFGGGHRARARRGRSACVDDGVESPAGAPMIGPSGNTQILVATKPVDFRKQADSLAALVQEALGADPFCGTVYVFRAKRADRVKLIWWDGTGLCLLSKRLEGGQFRWPRIEDGVMRLTPAQLSALVEGLDWARVAPREVERPRAAQ